MSSQFSPTIVIGLGGTGQEVLVHLKKSLLEENNGRLPEEVRLLAFDTQSLKSTSLSEQNISNGFFRNDSLGLDAHEYVYLGSGDLYRFIETLERDNKSDYQNYLGSRWLLSHLPKNAFDLSSGSGHDRVLGKYSFLYDLRGGSSNSRIIRALEDTLQRVRSFEEVRVLVVSSLAGDMGSSWVIDFPVLLQQIANRHKMRVHLRAFVILPDALPRKGFLPEVETRAAAFSAWRELDRLMGAKPENPQVLEYPGSESPFDRIVLERPLYDHCYVFGRKEQNPDDNRSIYSEIAETLLAFTDSGVDSSVKATENSASVQKYSGEDGKYYQGVGVYSVRRPLYWLTKHLAGQYLLQKWNEMFRVQPTEKRVGAWAPPRPRHSFLDVFTENSPFFNIQKFLWHLRDFAGYHQDKFRLVSPSLPGEFEVLFKAFFIAILNPQNPEYLSAQRIMNFEHLDESISSLRDLIRYPELLQPEVEAIQNERRRVLGDTFDTGNSGVFRENLSIASERLYNQFVDFIENYVNNLFQSERELYADIGSFGYTFWLLTDLQDILAKSHEIILRKIEIIQKEREGLRLRARNDRALKDLIGQAERSLVVRWLSMKRATTTYIDTLRIEHQYWVNYQALQDIYDVVTKMLDLVTELSRQLDLASRKLFLEPDNLMHRFKQESDSSLNQYKERASVYSAESADISMEVDRRLERINRLKVDFPFKWDFVKSVKRDSDSVNERTTLDMALSFSDSMTNTFQFRINPSDSSRQAQERWLMLAQYLENWAFHTADEVVMSDEFYGTTIYSENLSALIVEKSKPWLLPQDVYLIHSPESRVEGMRMLSRRFALPSNTETNITEVTATRFSGLMLLQFSKVMSAGEIETFQQYQLAYYSVYGGRQQENPARHVLPGEAAAFRYECQIAYKWNLPAKPLYNPVVRLLQSEYLFELFLRAFAIKFISTSRNDEGEVWYQLSHPELRNEIYLTLPERTSENIILKLPEAFSTFVLKGYDARPRNSESKIDYRTLQGALIRSYRELLAAPAKRHGSDEFVNAEEEALIKYYEAFLASVSPRQSERHNKTFNDLMAVIDVMIQRWKGVSYQIRTVERRPILRVSDNYVVAKPLTQLSKNLFVGREKHFESIENIWKNQLQKASIVLYGQRRMGKTSLLYQLEARLGSGYLTVIIDFQGLGPQVKTESDFWRLMGKQIHRKLEERGITIGRQIDTAEILSPENFDDYIYAIEKNLAIDQWLVLLIDEFEKIEEKIDAGIMPNNIFDSLRHIIQHRDKIIILLAGHHTLQERMKQYWNPLMETAINVKLSYLSKEEARHLIESPWDNFELRYDKPALERIIEVCGGQPLLIQLVCKGVINRINQRLQETGGHVSPTATRSDVEAVLHRMVVAEDHDADTITFFFDAVWSWLKEDEKEYLETLARIPDLDKDGWINRSEFNTITDNEELLERLVERDVLEKSVRGYRFRVDLLKQWVKHRFSKQ